MVSSPILEACTCFPLVYTLHFADGALQSLGNHSLTMNTEWCMIRREALLLQVGSPCFRSTLLYPRTSSCYAFCSGCSIVHLQL